MAMTVVVDLAKNPNRPILRATARRQVIGSKTTARCGDINRYFAESSFVSQGIVIDANGSVVKLDSR